MIYEITNIDGVAKELTTDKDFVQYAKSLWAENEEIDTWIKEPYNVETAEHYIATYCSNLELIIF